MPTCRRRWPASNTRVRSRVLGAVRRADPGPAGSAFEQPAWWDELASGRPVVHVTQGTLDNADLGRLLLVTTRALAGDDVLVVATTGGPDPAPLRRGLPANVPLERFVPHDVLLPHVDVMVTNGGYGGVQQALAHGVPLVVAGDSEDKPEVAARVQWTGAGINLHTGRPSPAMVAHAVRRVLGRDSYRQRAEALQAEIAATDPLDAIGGVLAELCRGERRRAPARDGLNRSAGYSRRHAGRVQFRPCAPAAGNPTHPPRLVPRVGILEDLPARELHRGLFHLLFGREPAPDDPFVAELEQGTKSPRQMMEWLIHSAEWSHSGP